MTAPGPRTWAALPLAAWALFLLAVPFLPTQDGGAHVATGSMWWDCLLGRGPASLVYELHAGMATNVLSNLLLGGLQCVGLGPRLTEALFVLLLLALLVAAWRPLLRRAGAPPWAVALVLLPFGGQVLAMGFYNFMLGVHLGLLGFALRGDRAFRPAGDALFVLALLAHPLGAATWLGLVGGRALLRALPGPWAVGGPVEPRRQARVLVALLPHLLLLYWVTKVSAGEVVPDLGTTVGPDVEFARQWPDLLGAAFVPLRGEPALPGLLLRVALLALLAGRLVTCWRALPGDARRARLELALLALPPLVLSGLAPPILGPATHLRERAAYLAWLLLLPALAPVPAGGRVPRPVAGGVLVAGLGIPALVLPALFALARLQQDLLDRLPVPRRGAIVLAGFDQMTRDSLLRVMQPGGVVAEPVVPRDYRRYSVAWNRARLTFEPWLHLGYRWAHEGGAVNLNNHQAWYPHSPIRYRDPRDRPSLEFRNLLEYAARFFPVAAAGGLCDELLLMNLPEDWPTWLEPRLGASWRIDGRGPTFARLVAVDPPGVPHGHPLLQGAIPHGAAPVPVRPNQGPTIDAGPARAHRRFAAFLVAPDLRRFEDAPPDLVAPPEGRFDADGRFRFTRLAPPATGQGFLVLLPQ
ncbi:MAG: hypothetical protein R3F30_03370 [Planctomycetota bacterium]